MTPTLADLLPYLLAIVALALLMVYVMVRWSRVAVSLTSLRLPESGDPLRAPAVRWSFAYAAVLGALIAAYLALLRHLGTGTVPQNLLLLILGAAGWLAFNLLLVLFIRALARTQPAPPDAADRALDESAAGPQPEVQAQGPGLRARLLNAFRMVRNVVLALLVMAIGEALPPLRLLDAWTRTHQRPLLAAAITMTAAGFILLMGMAIHLVLAGGKPLSRREIDGLAARRLTSRQALWRRAAYRSGGVAVGGQGEDGATLAEIKAAWRSGAWRVSPRWRRLFAGLFGTALLATGMFGLFVVLGSPGVKLLCGGALVFVWVRSVSAFVRA